MMFLPPSIERGTCVLSNRHNALKLNRETGALLQVCRVTCPLMAVTCPLKAVFKHEEIIIIFFCHQGCGVSFISPFPSHSKLSFHSFNNRIMMQAPYHFGLII